MLEAGKKFKIFLFFKNKKFPASHNRKKFSDEKFIKGSPFIFFLGSKKFSYCGKQEKNFFKISKKFIILGTNFDPKIILFWFILGMLKFWENRIVRSSSFLFPKWEKSRLQPILRSSLRRLCVAIFMIP